MKICKKEYCTACTACKSICPTQCITMKTNEYGNKVYSIDESKCILCKKCQSVCPSLNYTDFKKPQDVFALYSKEKDIRQSSASGGASNTFCTFVVQNGGVAYGAAFKNNIEVCHQRIDSIDDLKKLQGSKYVHSSTDNIYPIVKNDLDIGKSVIFTGTPCQVAGLKSYLQKDYSNLLTCDLVCHGVPSQSTFAKYIKSEVNENQIGSLTFRDNKGWGVKVLDKNNNTVCRLDLKNSHYYNGFMEGYIYRQNCYHCPYAQSSRVGDITIGDFWGIGTKEPFAENANEALRLGLSLVMINAKKGSEFFDKTKKQFVLYPRTLDEAVQKNKQLNAPVPQTAVSIKYQNLMAKKGFDYAISHCNKKKSMAINFRIWLSHHNSIKKLCLKIPVLKDKL